MLWIHILEQDVLVGAHTKNLQLALAGSRTRLRQGCPLLPLRFCFFINLLLLLAANLDELEDLDSVGLEARRYEHFKVLDHLRQIVEMRLLNDIRFHIDEGVVLRGPLLCFVFVGGQLDLSERVLALHHLWVVSQDEELFLLSVDVLRDWAQHHSVVALRGSPSAGYERAGLQLDACSLFDIFSNQLVELYSASGESFAETIEVVDLDGEDGLSRNVLAAVQEAKDVHLVLLCHQDALYVLLAGILLQGLQSEHLVLSMEER